MSNECKPMMMAVDDNPLNLQLLVEGLGNMFQIVCCTDGNEAVALVEACHPELILLDIQMPGMSGYEVLQKIKEIEAVKDVPVIFLTAMSQLEDEIKGLEYGAVDYITKPFDMRIVKMRVKTQLELRRKTRLLEERTKQLEAALEDLRTLKEIIPICMYCKKIRDDDGYWNQLEAYIAKHTGSNFSHGICPECLREHFGDEMADKIESKTNVRKNQERLMYSKILLVDDEANVLSALKRALFDEPLEITTVGGGEDALAVMAREKFKLVVSDERMLGMQGSEFLAHVREQYPDTIRILLTGHATLDAAMKAVNEGEIYRFFAKPWSDHDLVFAIRSGIEKFDLEAENKRLLATLKEKSLEIKVLEKRYPGISRVEKDEQGNFILTDLKEDELQRILLECDSDSV